MAVPDADIQLGVDNIETFVFQAEINQLMSLIINNFYTDKEIFLRELISNASDALERIRFELLTAETKLKSPPELRIEIVADKVNKTISVTDNGVGMTKTELVNNLGTIAGSGTKEFMKSFKPSMIGQFGLGFYSAFLVAEKVVVITKHNDDDQQWVWESQAGGSFTVHKDVHGEQLGRGTRVILYLKDDQLEYLEHGRIKNIVRKYSDFISYPIYLLVENFYEKEDSSDEGNDTGKEQEHGVGDVVEEKDNNPKNQKKKKIVKLEWIHEWEKINQEKPIWLRKPPEITKEEYAAFYKSLSNDWEDHLGVTHFSVEGQLVFKAILFVPRWAQYHHFNFNASNSIKLYVRSIFLTDKCEELIPGYLGFIKGIVDADDLPLNMSREMLQQNQILKVIRKNIVKKSIEMFNEIAENEEEYSMFYKAFSQHLKVAVRYENETNRAKFVDLLRYHSTMSRDEMTTFKDYITRMIEGQKDIYYVTGESKEAVENSPFLEKLKTQGYEVLFMIDSIDESMIEQLKEYDGKKLVPVTKEGLMLEESEEERTAQEEKKKSFEKLCQVMKDVLGNKVAKVIVSDRIVFSPCIIVTGEFGWTPNMERVTKLAQTLDVRSMSPKYVISQKTMEINPDNGIMEKLRERAEIDPNNESLGESVEILYQTALLTSGFRLDDPNEYGGRIHRILELCLRIEETETKPMEEAYKGISLDEID